MSVLAAQPGEKGLGTRPLVGTTVGATEGGTGVRGIMDAPAVLLSFPSPTSTLDRAKEMDDSRFITFSDNRRQFRVDTRKGLLPVNSSSIAASGPVIDNCSPVIVSEIWGEKNGRMQSVKWHRKPQNRDDDR